MWRLALRASWQYSRDQVRWQPEQLHGPRPVPLPRRHPNCGAARRRGPTAYAALRPAQKVCVEIRPWLEHIRRGIAINLLCFNLLRPPNSGAPPSLPPPPQCHLSRCRRGTGLTRGGPSEARNPSWRRPVRGGRARWFRAMALAARICLVSVPGAARSTSDNWTAASGGDV